MTRRIQGTFVPKTGTREERLEFLSRWLAGEVVRLRTGLEFYAYSHTYEPTRSGDTEPIWVDKGFEARRTLGWREPEGDGNAKAG